MAHLIKRTTARGPRCDVRYRDPAGRVHTRTFTRRIDADRYAVNVQADLFAGAWVDPEAGRVALADYAGEWLAARHGLRPRTRELYESLLRHHVLPALGDVELARLTPTLVRRWHADLSQRTGAVTVAKCYRLLRSVLGIAVADQLLVRNPCTVAGAGVERSPERPTASIPQVVAIADAFDERYRAVVLTAALTGCRWGELAGLRRRRLDLLHATLTVAETLSEGRSGVSFGPPKTDAGRRTVALSARLVPVLEDHVARFSASGPDGLVFVGEKGAPLRRNYFRPRWLAACAAVGVEGLHFHDLRHTANTLAAATGASTRELMARMGHASPRAALLYQHATQDRDAAIARALDEAWSGHLAPVVELGPRDGRAMDTP